MRKPTKQKSWQKLVQSAKKERSSRADTRTVFVLQSSTLPAKTASTQTSSGHPQQMDLA